MKKFILLLTLTFALNANAQIAESQPKNTFKSTLHEAGFSLNTGASLFTLGSICIAVPYTMIVLSKQGSLDDDQYKISGGIMLGGAIIDVIGLAYIIRSGNKLMEASDKTAFIKVGSQPNGLGISLNF